MAGISRMAGALTATEFKHAVARFPRLSDKAKSIARGVLVEGRTFDEMSQQYGASRQLIHKWSTQVFNAFQPEGWVTETVTLPKDQMELVREMERVARQELSGALPPPRVAHRKAR